MFEFLCEKAAELIPGAVVEMEGHREFRLTKGEKILIGYPESNPEQLVIIAVVNPRTAYRMDLRPSLAIHGYMKTRSGWALVERVPTGIVMRTKGAIFYKVPANARGTRNCLPLAVLEKMVRVIHTSP